jgi:hypothetical protein
MKAAAVGLDDQGDVRPIEVDSVLVDVDLRQWLAQPGSPGDRNEQPLELRVSEDECRTVD